MTSVAVETRFEIERPAGSSWSYVGKARDLEIAMLRARALFREDKALRELRIIATLPTGVKRIYTVERPENAARSADADNFGIRPILPLAYRLWLLAVAGISVGALGVILHQMVRLITDVQAPRVLATIW